MLLPDNIHPEHCIYYNGAFVLQELQRQTKQHLLDLYQAVKQQKNMTFPVFVLCLDWLFLINVAVINDTGEVELCS
ncbi:MAG: hypothetical protein NT038_10610 [Euryarchaeota archaeon]|nr:hypothetical protein [Euryarchaeota archaeon]